MPMAAHVTDGKHYLPELGALGVQSLTAHPGEEEEEEKKKKNE